MLRLFAGLEELAAFLSRHKACAKGCERTLGQTGVGEGERGKGVVCDEMGRTRKHGAYVLFLRLTRVHRHRDVAASLSVRKARSGSLHPSTGDASAGVGRPAPETLLRVLLSDASNLSHFLACYS